MNTRVTQSVVRLLIAAGLVLLAVSVVSSAAWAQDMPGAPSPAASGNADYAAPVPPGLDNPPVYGISNDLPKCLPNASNYPCVGSVSISKPLPPATEGLKNIERYDAQIGPRGFHRRHHLPHAQRLDPSIEAWMNSPAYKAWESTHNHSGSMMWNCRASLGPGHDYFSSTKEGCYAASPPPGSVKIGNDGRVVR